MAPDAQEIAFKRALANADVVLDCIFGECTTLQSDYEASWRLHPRCSWPGFSFHGSPRPPFDSVLRALKAQGAPPVLSVDIPSGWDVEQGDVNGDGLVPGEDDSGGVHDCS